MKKTIAILALAATSAYGQDFINWNNLTDIAGDKLFSGTASSGSQTFDISTDGSGCFLEVSWGVTGTGNFVSGPGGGTVISNLQAIGDNASGSNFVSFTLLNAVADWDILSQPDNTSAPNEFGTLTSDAAIDYTVISGLASISGDNTGLVTYGNTTGENGQFSATITGGTTFTYEYDNQGRPANTQSVDSFRIGIDTASLTHVPEPSTALLGALAALGFVARRRRA